VLGGAEGARLLQVDQRGQARGAVGVAGREQRVLEPGEGAGVQLRDARLVDAERLPDLLHRGVVEVVEREQLAVTRLQAGHRLAEAGAPLHHHIPLVGQRRGAGHAAGRQVGVGAVAARGRRGGLDGVDAHDHAAEAFLVGAEMGGQVGQRRLGAGRDAQRLAGGLDLAAHAADAARPGVATQRVDHGAAHAALGKCLEADTAPLVVAVDGVDEAEHAVLDEVADIDARRHRGRHATRQGFHERPAGDHPTLLVFTKGLQHVSLLSLAAGISSAGPGSHRHRPSIEQRRCQLRDRASNN